MVLNYYEFLAIGIKQGDLDARVIEDYYHGMLCRTCDKARMFIKLDRIDSKDDRLYENLIDLYKAWKPSRSFPDSE